jgi:hypothetical protein
VRKANRAAGCLRGGGAGRDGGMRLQDAWNEVYLQCYRILRGKHGDFMRLAEQHCRNKSFGECAASGDCECAASGECLGGRAG